MLMAAHHGANLARPESGIRDTAAPNPIDRAEAYAGGTSLAIALVENLRGLIPLMWLGQRGCELAKSQLMIELIQSNMMQLYVARVRPAFSVR